MVEVKQTDEEFVRGVWEWAGICDRKSRVSGEIEYSVSLGGNLFTRHATDWFPSEAEAWANAAIYTRELLEEVRQLRNQIEWAKAFIFDMSTEYPNGVSFILEEPPTLDEQLEGTAARAREDATGLMLVARLESILTDKLTGMKAGA